MEIIWHGHSCFTIKSATGTVVVDPFNGLGVKLPKLSANLVTLGDMNGLEKGEIAPVEGDPKVFDCPGEYEASGVAFQGLNASDFSENAGYSDDTTIFVFVIEGIRVCHLSGVAHELNDGLIEEIGDVDLLMLPVGGGSVLSGKVAQQVMEAIEPRIVIPMYYNATESNLGIGGPEDFLKVIGQPNLEPQDSFVIKGRTALPEESMQFVVLTPTI